MFKNFRKVKVANGISIIVKKEVPFWQVPKTKRQLKKLFNEMFDEKKYKDEVTESFYNFMAYGTTFNPDLDKKIFTGD